MLSHTAVRQREFAMRAALGAGRKHLILQLFAEVSLLWMIGCIFGLLLGHWALRILIAAAPSDLPVDITAHLDSTVFVFALILTVTTSIIFGMAPAIRFSSPNVLDALKEGSRSGGAGKGRTRLRTALVVGQVALTMILLAGSGLMLRSFQKLVHVDAGFGAEKLLTMEYRLPINKYPDPAQQSQTHHQILERIRQLPGVESASLTDGLPFSGNAGDRTAFEIVGRTTPGESLRGRILMVEKEYFHTMQIPIYMGRAFRDQDRPDTTPVVIINRYLADRYWPNGDPIGAKIKIPNETQQIVAEIIGIAGNTKHFGLDDPEIGFIYGAQSQTPDIFNTIAVRTIGDPMAMANSVRAAVWSVDPDQPVWKIRTQEFLIDRSLGIPKFLAQLMGCYAALALLLAAIGMYGVISYSVTQQTYEFGVRMALGAQRKDVLRMVLRHGIVLTASGLFIGVVGALALGRLVQALLFRTNASDPLTLVIVAGILVSIALLASYLPARRAASVDPLTSLRYE
jgi:putative ABC transport system permease protein